MKVAHQRGEHDARNVFASAELHWRKDEGETKNECNRILEMKVENEAVSRRHDGWELVSGTYIEHDAAEDRDRCFRLQDLIFGM